MTVENNNTEDDKNRFEKGNMYILNKEDPYHDWLFRLNAKRLDLKLIEDTLNEKRLKNLKYYGILEVPTLFYFELDKPLTPNKVKLIQEIQLRGRVICFGVEPKQRTSSLYRLTNKRTKAVPYVVDNIDEWKERYDYCSKLVIPRNVRFDSEVVRDTLTRLLIREPEYWATISILDDMFPNLYEVKLDDLQSIYPDIDFFNLNDWVRMIFQGLTKRKHLEMYYYYREVKKYSNVWLVNHLREEFKKLSIVYSAYRKGIIFDSTTNRLEERSKVRNWAYYQQLANLKTADINRAKYIIENLPYRHFMKVQELLFTSSEFLDKDTEVIELLERIREERTLYDEKDGRGTKVFQYNPRKRRRR